MATSPHKRLRSQTDSHLEGDHAGTDVRARANCDVPGWLPDPEPFIAAGRQCPHCSARPIIEGGRVTLPHREACSWARYRANPADIALLRQLHHERRTREANALNRRRGGAS